MNALMTACARVFDRAAKGHPTRNAAWIEDANGDDISCGGYICEDCAEKLVKGDQTIRGDGGSAMESDGPALCDECHEPIMMALTEYGIDRELRIVDDPECGQPELFPCCGPDARIICDIADGIGEFDEKKHGDRLLLIALATHYELGHGPGSWKKHPLVRAIIRERKRLGRLCEKVI